MHRKALAFIFTALAAVNLACDPVTRVTGTVKDKSGSPISDVTVTMYSLNNELPGESKKESEQQTDSSGRFNFVSITPNALRVSLTFEKEGYIVIEKEAQANGESEIDVVLESEAK